MATITEAQAGANVPAFLDLLAWSEGTSTEAITQNDGYDVIVTAEDPVTGRAHQETFTDYTDHPFAGGRAPNLIRRTPALESTASGRYQVICHWFEDYKEKLQLPDFSPLSQDLVAVQQIRERGALQHIVAGEIETAIELCSATWASLPGNSYGQAGGRTMAALLAQWTVLTAGAS